MAERRMFAKSVLESDGFLDLEPACQALYVQLNLQADDEGFVSAPKRVLRMLGVGAAAVDALVAAGLVLRFDSGILLIRHWLVHNKIRSDRRKGTLCQAEKAMVEVDGMGVYAEMQNAECKMQNGECEMRSGECEVRSGECKMQNAECKMQNGPLCHGEAVTAPPEGELCTSTGGGGVCRTEGSVISSKCAARIEKSSQNRRCEDPSAPLHSARDDIDEGAEVDGRAAADNQMATKWQPSDNQMATNCPHRLGKDRIGKDRIGEDREEEDRAAIAPSAAIGCPVAAPSMPAASSVAAPSMPAASSVAAPSMPAASSVAAPSMPAASSVATPSSVPAASSQKDILDVFQFYHRICVGFMPCKHLTKERKAAIGQALENWTKEELAAIFEKAEQTPFLKGENDRKWRVGFDWLIQKENLQKVQDGQYDDWRLKEAVPTGGHGLGDAEVEAVRLMMGMESEDMR